MTPNTSVVSIGEYHVTTEQCLRSFEEKKIVFNKIALDVPKEVAAQEIVNNGFLINVHCKELVKFVRAYNGKKAVVTRGIYRTLCKSVMVKVTYEQAQTLLNLLTLRQHYLTVDLNDTELFTAPDLWEKFGFSEKPYKKLFLVLSDASSTRYEDDVRSLAKKKKALKISALTFNVLCLFPIGIPLLIAGRKTSTCSNFHYTWHEIFNDQSTDDRLYII